jgi:hypothetical protein
MGLNKFKFIYIVIAMMTASSTSHAFTKSVLLTTDANEIYQTIEQTVSSNSKKKEYIKEVNQNKSTNQYKFKAVKNTPNEIEFKQLSSNLAIFKMVGSELETLKDNPNNPNKDISKLTFKRLDDKNILAVIDRISFENPNAPNHLHYEVQASFIQGDWVDLAANKPVTIAVSPQEESKSKRFIQAWMQRMVYNIAFSQAGDKIKQVLVKTGLEFRAPIIKGNLNEMVHTVNKTKVKFEINWSLFG